MLPFTTCLSKGWKRKLVLIDHFTTSGKQNNSSLSLEPDVVRWEHSLLKEINNPSMDDSLRSTLPDLSDECKNQTLERRVRPCCFYSGRFLTLHKRRKKRPPTRSITSEQALLDDLYHGPIRTLLERISEWPFNAFALDRATGGRPLPTLCFHLFHHYGLMAHFHLDPVKVWKFFSLVEEGYHSNNPYHNAIHAADVTQAMHCFLQEPKIRSNLTHLEIASSLIAAMTHDLDHPGVNQTFLVATSNHLASLYKNDSVLENHHWRSAMACLIESGLMDGLDCKSANELQQQIQSLILATDIARQAEFLSNFQSHLSKNSLDLSTADHRHFMLQIALKCADICNPCRPWEVSRAWSLQVSEEFYRQGDLERRLGLPVTPLCDRYISSVSKIQTGFFRFIAAPLFEEWHHFHATPLSWKMLNYLQSNKIKWEAILNGEVLGTAAQVDFQSHDSLWSEIGALETGIERINLRRASLPAGRSGLWTSNFSTALIDEESCKHNDEVDLPIARTLVSPLRCKPPSPQMNKDDCIQHGTDSANNVLESTGIHSELSGRLPHRRESLPFNFPYRSQGKCLFNRGRRESLPNSYSDNLNSNDVLPALNIICMTPFNFSWRQEIEINQSVRRPATSIPSTSSYYVCTDEKENAFSNDVQPDSRSTPRHTSATSALNPIYWLESQWGKRSLPLNNIRRHGSFRSGVKPVCEPSLRRRGSLPYELGRKPSTNNESGRIFTIPPDCSGKLNLCLRRGSAPSNLFRSANTTITSGLVLTRDRGKFSGKDIFSVCSGVGSIGESICSFTIRERRRRSLRRRRSGGPELFASVIRRGNNCSSAQLPPLPPVTCSHAKLEAVQSPSSENAKAWIMGLEDNHRDWLLLGRRGSGALELLAGLWRQNRDRSERTSFEYDDPQNKLHFPRQSIDSSSSSDGLPCSLDEYCNLFGQERMQRRGSCPVNNSLLEGHTEKAKPNWLEFHNR